MYRCKIIKNILRDVNLEKSFGCEAYFDIELPFVPFIGLRIQLAKLFTKIEDVEWQADEGVFLLYAKNTGAQITIPDNGSPEDRCSYEMCKKIALRSGWKLSEDFSEDFGKD